MNQFQIVIPLLNNGPYEQLRYSIRSMAAVYPAAEFIIVGGKPKWYKGYHLPFSDYHNSQKEQNIRDKVIEGSKGLGCFLFANDDHIIMFPIKETYNKGKLSESIKGRNPSGSYTRLLINTIAKYGDVDNVDTHCPMWMDSNLIKNTNFEWPLFGIGFKTCYAQENNIKSVYMPDCKVSKVPINKPWFSMTDQFNTRLLQNIFPTASKFEI